MIYEPGLIKKIDPDMENPYDFLQPLSNINVNCLKFTINQPNSNPHKQKRGEIDIYADETDRIYEEIKERPPDLPPSKPIVQLSCQRRLLQGTDSNATGTNTKVTTPLNLHQKQTSSGLVSKKISKQEQQLCKMKDWQKKKPFSSVLPEVHHKPPKEQHGPRASASENSVGVKAMDTKDTSTAIGYHQKKLISEIPPKVKSKPPKLQCKAEVPLPGSTDGTTDMGTKKINATEYDTIGMKSRLHLIALKQRSRPPIPFPRTPGNTTETENNSKGFEYDQREPMVDISDKPQAHLTSEIHSYANVLQTAAISPRVVAKDENQISQSEVVLHENKISQSGPEAQQVIGAPQQSGGASSKAISNLLQVPKDIEDLTVSQIGDCLRLLKLDKHVNDFEEIQIDGALLNALSAEMLHHELGISLLKATKLKQFCQGWRPKEDKK